MKQILPAIFTSTWKRKEAKVYLLFALFPIVYFLASFFGESNFMQISVDKGFQMSNIVFLDIMLNSVDGSILPTLAIYFLTISVFRKEIDTHTLFLYRDLNRRNIFFSKYLSLIGLVVIFYSLFFMVSTIVYYTRVIHMPIASLSFFGTDLKIAFSAFVSLCGLFAKDLLSIGIATSLCLCCKTGATMATAVMATLTMLITSIIGGPVGMLFPNGYSNLATEGLNQAGLAFLGIFGVTALCSIILLNIGVHKFNRLEF